MKLFSSLLGAILSSGLSTFTANAKPWYPADCLLVDQCYAVESVVWANSAQGAPHLIIVSSKGEARLMRRFRVLDSEDGRLHVCTRFDPFGDLEVTCLMVPRIDYLAQE